jgi:hypothetical protein
VLGQVGDGSGAGDFQSIVAEIVVFSPCCGLLHSSQGEKAIKAFIRSKKYPLTMSNGVEGVMVTKNPKGMWTLRVGERTAAETERVSQHGHLQVGIKHGWIGGWAGWCFHV